MKRFFSCVKGESSSNNRGNDDDDDVNTSNDFTVFNDERLFGENEELNNAWGSFLSNRSDQNPPQALSPETEALSPYGATIRWSEIFYETSNLRDDFLLGQGNFGEVYRCNFPRLHKVGAVKIQNQLSAEARSEFAAEIKTLHVADHPNVIKLLGKCLDGECRAIIYEFMPRGSLDRHIYADMRPRQGFRLQYARLDWGTRLQIAIGVANALIYVHEQLKTVHRDLKLANVLLDENFVPKLTDFGLATKIVEDKDGIERQSDLPLVKGTPGCIAPETEGCGLVSSKSDVYSYGVFLLTLFTGKKAYDRQKRDGKKKLSERMERVWERAESIPLTVDVALDNKFSGQGLERLFEVARMCLNPHVLLRPTMRVVETMVREAAVFQIPETTRHSI